MTIDEHLYMDLIPKKTADRLLKRIKKRKPNVGVYVVTLPLFADGMLEVYDANELLQPYYKKRWDEIRVVGISLTRRGAYLVVRDIVDDVYRQTGAFDCEQYFRAYAGAAS